MTLDELLALARESIAEDLAHRTPGGMPWHDADHVANVLGRERRFGQTILDLLGATRPDSYKPRYSALLDSFELAGGVIVMRSHMRAYAAMLLRAVDEVPQ